MPIELATTCLNSIVVVTTQYILLLTKSSLGEIYRHNESSIEGSNICSIFGDGRWKAIADCKCFDCCVNLKSVQTAAAAVRQRTLRGNESIL